MAYKLCRFRKDTPENVIQPEKKWQNDNAKIDVAGKVHPRQSSSRPSAVQTSRMVCRRKQARQGFLSSDCLRR